MSASHTSPTANPQSPTYTGYLTGYVLAAVLSVIPFGAVMLGGLSTHAVMVIIGLTALIQAAVQLKYFLHIDFKHSPKENLFALAFAVVLVVLMIGGSLWIVSDLNARMMPAMGANMEMPQEL
ncbi:Cytochrome bo(3) ubiquinol oxidase subunit 4 [Aquimixticola soesokkakensis]|uniref:Cytochrome bo(3) ubiquinol oxidase subunit 4 n=1 Tax=Aquimixticola soesokkakensis TaxID=1519096 RepID=A0A1Y5T4Y4_9RHOB|nr:cytochrome o ubiquinol oxidase subunit IV [Aquimixticola soesokkakensis]SLN55522.1 Cytochrome bo(3) ubiquinol oxidase subunit 4 [Aquimixticola soesokkakensis]